MKIIRLFLLPAFFVTSVFASGGNDVLKYKAKINFETHQDRIAEYQFFDGGRKVFLLGEKLLQIWDVENNTLLSSAPHQIPQFASKGFFHDYVLLGLPLAFKWKPFLVDPEGKWIVTIEKTNDSKVKSAIVRDLKTVKQIAVLTMGDVSVDYVAYDESKNEILTCGETDKKSAFANWNRSDFARARQFSVSEHKWHRLIDGERKMIVGSGDTKIAWGSLTKQGEKLTLRDVKTGAIEKEYTAENLKPETTFLDTTVSDDERFLISRRNDRIFVWEIGGDGRPKFEISSPNPKDNLELRKIAGNRYIVVSLNKDLHIYDAAATDATPKITLRSPKFNDSVKFYDATRNGRYIVVSDDETISILDMNAPNQPVYKVSVATERTDFTIVKIVDDENYLAVGRVNRRFGLPERAEFYELATGKIAFELYGAINYALAFTPDRRFIYMTSTGSTRVWNIAEKTSYFISLDTDTTDCDEKDVNCTEYTYNTEQTALSPDGKWFLRYGDRRVTVFDVETGTAQQTIFDPQGVIYNKKNSKIKRSGLGEAGWSENGKYVYAFGQAGRWKTRKSVNLWDLER